MNAWRARLTDIGGAAAVIALGFLTGWSNVIVPIGSVAVFGPPLAWLFIRYALPRRAAEGVRRIVDPEAGPPATAQPVKLELAGKWADSQSRMDRNRAAELLDEEFFYINPRTGRQASKKRHLKTMRFMKLAYPTSDVTVDQVVAEPGAEQVVWVRLTSVAHPHSGPDLNTTTWEKWTLDDSRERLRDATLVGVTRVD